ncbi:zf-DHHC-domain-containing protein, partial [Ascodesmis nigricans]
MLDPSLSHLAVAGVLILITTLAFLPQLTILHDLSLDARIFFNFLVALTYLTYYLAVTTPPGRVPAGWTPVSVEAAALEDGSLSTSPAQPPTTSAAAADTSGEEPSPPTSTIISSPPRFCTPCNAFKPPRTHHCRVCSTCIPKMDHHCPWLSTCIGYSNHPHFLRFLCATTAAVTVLNFLLLGEWIALYDAWDLPAYLFPHGAWGMGLLVGVSLVGVVTGLVVFVLLCRSIGNAATGRTTIEAWEIERWEVRRRRRGVGGGVYPMDMGIYENMKVALGGR